MAMFALDDTARNTVHSCTIFSAKDSFLNLQLIMNKIKKFFVKSEKVRQVSDHVVHLPRRLVDTRMR